MLRSIILSLLLLAAPAWATNPTGSADQVLRIPGAGGLGKYGQVDLSKSAAVKNQLPEVNGGTGKGSYTKGDLLCAQSSTTLLRLGVGSDGQFLTADSTQTCGVKWTAAAQPAGSIMAFAGSSCPSGSLAMDGTTASRTTYSTLFGIIGTTYGVGDGSTTFTLPNAKGVFLRGSGSQTISSVTYSGTRGTSSRATTGLPVNAFVTGTQSDDGLHDTSASRTVAIGQSGSSYGVQDALTTGSSGLLKENAHTHTVTSGGDTETAPANIVVTYCVFY